MNTPVDELPAGASRLPYPGIVGGRKPNFAAIHRCRPQIVDLDSADRFPLWYYLVHIVTHSEPQRRDAANLLLNHGHRVPDVEFLYYADALSTPDPAPQRSTEHDEKERGQ